MKKDFLKNSIVCFILITILFSTKSFSQNLTRIQNANFIGSDLNVGDCTPVTTYKNSMYVAWIEGRTLKVSKKSSNGSTTTSIIRNNIQNDKYHVMPSIAIDKTGYIHITADVHNQDWVYYISNNPESINSFTRYNPGTNQCPDGVEITYPEFFKDINNELYLTYRHQTQYNGDVAGKMGGAIARYNVQSKSWTMLGGISHGGDKTMIWANGGANKKGFYQKPLIRLFWDNTNRMHLVTTVAVENAPNRTNNGMTDVLYAYSDDEGITWKKANGRTINNLPLTRNNASVVSNRSNQKDIISGARIAAFDRDKPVVAYQIGEGSNKQLYLKTWNGSSWIEVNAPYKSTALYARRNGEVVIFRPYNGWYITKDKGNTWTNMRSSPSDYNGVSDQIDYEHYLTSGDFRWRTVDRNAYKVSIYTYDRDEPLEEVPSSTSFTINDYTPPTTIVPGESYNFNISYVGIGEADLRISLQNKDQNYENEGTTRISVNGTGTTTINVMVDSDATLGTNYQWQAYISPVGGNWSNRYDNKLVENISVISPEFSIQNYTPPAVVVPGESYTIKIPYLGTGAADMNISLQNIDDNWTTEGASRLLIHDNGTAILNVSVNSNAKPGSNYIWQAYITPVGENWSKRYDNKQINNIRCISTRNDTSQNLKIQDLDIDFYPNPVSNFLTLKKRPLLEEIQSIKIYNLQGKIIKIISKNQLIKNNELLIDVSENAEGIYILSLGFLKKETQNFKFIIKH
ncbi:BNR-4 repeat-containing protein [uncultured Aquimarina sp.]|uniref:BNR-4 repeat-containing protein n=1 Tax=uncultured Aquimarina sp. TaxID=575652 RepID=UPI0026057A65|nr:BNR-4 repeat-containing protein [uncultured Aquimarina sp.]